MKLAEIALLHGPDALAELREIIRNSKKFKGDMARTGFDPEAALDSEVYYYVSEGSFMREMAHQRRLACCQYDRSGRCVICGGIKLKNPHPNFR